MTRGSSSPTIRRALMKRRACDSGKDESAPRASTGAWAGAGGGSASSRASGSRILAWVGLLMAAELPFRKEGERNNRGGFQHTGYKLKVQGSKLTRTEPRAVASGSRPPKAMRRG